MDPALNNSPSFSQDPPATPAAPTSGGPQIGFPAQTEDQQPGFSPTPVNTFVNTTPVGVGLDGITTTSSGGSNKGTNKKKIIIGALVLVMFLGIAAGIYALQRSRPEDASAWNCSLYVSSLEPNGSLIVTNGSNRTEPAAVARISLNNVEVGTVNVPSLVPGQGVTLQSNVSLPANESYSWKVQIAECTSQGTAEVAQAKATCSEVKAYDENWKLLSSAELASLKKGDMVRFTVSGSASTGSFDMARFSVNGATAVTATDKKPSSEEFYLEYKIPEDEGTYNVTAEIHHSEYGWF